MLVSVDVVSILLFTLIQLASYERLNTNRTPTFLTKTQKGWSTVRIPNKVYGKLTIHFSSAII